MYCWLTSSTTAVFILALYISVIEARLHKRSGYHYHPSSSSSSSSGGSSHGDLYEPSHEIVTSSHSDHELSHGNGDVYQSAYFDYKTSPLAGAPPSSGSSGKQGHSIGSGLRSIAQGSANQAYTAVASQHAAAKQAAFIAKNTLAQAASQAAATAQAALAGKRVILQELEQQAAEAQHSLGRELDQLKAAKIAAKLAQQTAQAAYNHVSVLTAAVNNAKSVAEQSEQASNEVANQLASQSSMVGQAKSRLEQVEEQLKQARIDYEATKEAALKASSSAAEAQVNASKAGAHATIGLHESTSQHQQHSESNDDVYDEHVETTATGHSGPDHP